MKHRLLYFFASICFSWTVLPTLAQDSVKLWTIQDCFRYAALHNIQINSLRLNQEAAVQNLLAAEGSRIPNLYGSVSNNFTNANKQVGTDDHLVSQLISTGNYSLNSSIVLWNDHAVRNNIQQRDLLVQLAGLSIEQSKNSITLFITQAYLDILLAKENRRYIIDLVATSKARVRQGEMFYDAGSIAKKDLLQLQAELASDQYLLVQNENAVRQNILSLKQILQLPSTETFDIVIPEFSEAERMLPSLAYVQQVAEQNFPEIKIGKLDMDIALLDIEMARAGFKPTLTLNGGMGTGYAKIITNSTSPKSGYFMQTGENFNQHLGVTLSIPIFSNRVNRTNLEKANIALRQAELNFQNYRLVLSQAVEQAYLNATNARHAYEAARVQLIAAQETYRIVNEQFRLGGMNIYDQLQQRNQYVQAVQAFTQAKYTAVLEQRIFEFYLGRPVTL